MKNETKSQIKELAYFSTLGFQVAFSIIIGYGIGWYLDQHVFDSEPWCTYIFLVFGIIAGFKNIGLAIKKIRKF